MINIFEITDDLPDVLKSELTGVKETKIARLIALLKIANRPLTLNEIIIGYYRKYNEVITRKKAIGILYQGTRRGLVVHTASGYTLQPKEINYASQPLSESTRRNSL